MISEELQKKIDRAIRLLKSIPLKEGEKVEVAYSGGKDSDVILQLTKESGIPYRAIYRNTTIDPPGTIAHAKEMGAEVLMPKQSFKEIVRHRGYPSRFARFCCSILKEYKILDRQIVGVRRSESKKRAEMYNEPELCRKYTSKESARQYLPILEWTDQDVADFIADRNIKCAPVYYDEQGQFHVERRLGCMGCPLKSRKKRLEEFRQHPNLVKAWILWGGGEKYMQYSPNAKSQKWYKDSYEAFVYNLFYDSREDFNTAIHSPLLGDVDCKKFLEDYFKIKF